MNHLTTVHLLWNVSHDVFGSENTNTLIFDVKPGLIVRHWCRLRCLLGSLLSASYKVYEIQPLRFAGVQ